MLQQVIRWMQGRPRSTWIAAALLLAGAVLLGYSAAARTTVAILWVTGNVGLLLCVSAWGVFHPRSTLPGAGAAFQWGAGFTLAVLVFGTTAIQLALAENLSVKIPSGFVAVLGLVVGLVVLPAAWAWGMCGVALGRFFHRRAPAADAIAMGIGSWWLVSLSGILTTLALSGDEPWGGAVWWLGGVPVLALVLFRCLEHCGWTLRRGVDFVVAWLARRLVWRRSVHGLARRVDFRGAAVGMWAGLVVLAAWAAGLVTPLAADALVAMIQLRNEPISSGGLSLHWAITRGGAQGRRIVRLELDTASRNQVLRRGSEAALQAQVIETLRAWKPALIVLPSPQLSLVGAAAQASGPQPDGDEFARCRRDLPRLTDAVKAAGNVVLALAPAPLPDDGARSREQYRRDHTELKRLQAAAMASGHTRLTAVGTLRLPAVPMTWLGEPPLPFTVAAAAAGRPREVQARAGGGVEVAGRFIPGVHGRRLLIDFTGAGSGSEFPTATYGEILRHEPVYVAAPFEPGGQQVVFSGNLLGHWEDGPVFFRDRIVFLDSLSAHQHDTPVGSASRWEVLAAATSTLLRRSGLGEAAAWFFASWVLGIGMLTGLLCAGRNPLRAFWTTGALALGIVTASFGALVLGTWLDPVAPVLAAILALVLATQLTVSVERGERERNRALLQRFASPQVVEELLDDPDFLPGLGGKRQQVVVLFADARGFTAFAEGHSPEAVIDVTNTYLSALTDVVHSHGGILDKYTGDGLMALFLVRSGAPDAVQRAVHAALAMQQAALRGGAELAARGAGTLAFGIGLHFGEAVVGFVGNPDRLDYTALGHTVVVSQRLQSIALGGEVIVSETVAATLAGVLPLTPGEPVQVKGLSGPVTPYRLSAA